MSFIGLTFLDFPLADFFVKRIEENHEDKKEKRQVYRLISCQTFKEETSNEVAMLLSKSTIVRKPMLHGVNFINILSSFTIS